VNPTFIADKPGSYVLQLIVNDGKVDSAPDTVAINTENSKPVADAGSDQTGYSGDTINLNGAGSSDVDGDPLTYRWSFTSRPSGSSAALSNPGIVNPNFTADLEGIYVIQLIVNDGKVDSEPDTVTITVSVKMVTVPNIVGIVQSFAQSAILAAELTIGSVTTSYSNTVPAGSVISQSPSAGTSVPKGSAVSFAVSLGLPLVNVPNLVGITQAVAAATLSAAGLTMGTVTMESNETVPAGTVIRQNPAAGTMVTAGSAVNIVVSSGPAVPQLASILVTPASPTITTSASQQFTAIGILENGSSQVLTAGAVWGSSNPAVAFVSSTPGLIGSAAAGTVTISASYGGKTGSAVMTIVQKTPNTTPPTAEITSPVDQAFIVTPVPVIGTATDPEFLKYIVEIAPVGVASYTAIAESTTQVTNGTLGILDPTLLINGLYNLRLRVIDRGGIMVTTPSIQVHIKREVKVGNFTLAFSDSNIPYACLPVTVTRVYDSRDKKVGDFGVGWRLDLQTLQLHETGTMGTGWAIDRVNKPGPFGMTIQTYVLYDTAPHMVSLTLPDGQVEEFDLKPSPSEKQLTPIGTLTLTFTPRPGTLGSLEPVTASATYAPSYDIGTTELIDSNVTVFDPQQYRYTSKDGSVYLIDKTAGVQKVQCSNGMAITVTPGGIRHDSGGGVTFTRDNLGRITSLTDPNGRTQTYTYDANGDLADHTDAGGNKTDFLYNYSHGLIEIRDPRGVAAIRNEYDNDGRLISSTDPLGGKSTFDHDLVARRETVTDRLGQVTVHEYDASGNIIRTTDPLGGVTTRTYDAFGNELTRTDQLGRTTSFEYDSRRNVTKETDGLGNTTSYTYNALNQVTQVSDPMGRVTTNTYDTSGNLTQSRDALGNTTTYIYDMGGVIIPGSGNLLSKTDALGNVTTYGYDIYGRLTKETDALGRATSYTYDANGNRLTQTATRVVNGVTETLTTRFEYDANNRLTKTTHPDGSITRTEYNAVGKQAKTIDALGRITSYEYDALGRLARTAYPDGTSETSAYDAEGRRIAGTDRAGRSTTYTYDALGRLTGTTYADGTGSGTSYDAAGQVVASTDGNGNTTSYGYDTAGRRTSVADATGAVTSFAYDAAGNQMEVTDANGNTVAFTYDANNRRTQTIYADGTFDTVTYDDLGRQVSKTDQAGKTTQFGYDALGRLLQVTDALGQITRYGYDAQGNQISQTDALGRVTRFTYDKMGRRTSRTLPLGMRETMTYDNAGNLVSKTDFNGKTTTYAYDSVHRLLSKTPDPSFGQPAVHFTYTATGQRETMQDAGGITNYTYDNRDRLLAKATPQGTLNYTYDAAGNLTLITSGNAGGAQMSYTYDARNRLASVTDRQGTTTYGYDQAGNLAGFLYPNGVQTTYTYNALNRLISVAGTRGGILAGYSYTLGPAGNRTSVTEESGRKADYTYDALYRLNGEMVSGDPAGKNGAVGYTYDAVGNRLVRTSTLPGVPAQSFAYDANDRITSESYDANGNTLVSGTHSYSWDFENKLTSVDFGNVMFVYDGDGNRVSRTSGGVTTQFLVDDRNPTGYAQVLEEISGGTVKKTYTYGLRLINQQQGSGVSYYGFDGHGSVRYLTDAAGTVTDTYDYDAFGNLVRQTGATKNVYLYAGEQVDTSLDLVYLRARFFTPETGRFIVTDYFTGHLPDPLSLHDYVYANNDPTNQYDPLGLFSSAFGNMVHEEVQNQYKTDPKHAGHEMTFGKPANIGDYFALKPDILNKTKRRWLEIKPLSISGLASGVSQVSWYGASLCPEDYWPDIGWEIPDPFPIVNGTPVALIHTGALIFYTDQKVTTVEIAAATSIAMARLLQKTLEMRATVSLVDDMVWIRRMIPAALSANRSRTYVPPVTIFLGVPF
jgi:RHS repeat-associated protein